MSQSFSKLKYSINPEEDARKKIEPLLDEYTRFSWRNEDAWTKFGAFIISDKLGDLKFYSGAEFSNEYSKPQFSDNPGDLLGVSFSTPQISFKVGFYFISEKTYRQILAWLSPYEVSWLSIGYDTDWQYQAKVSKIGSISRYIVGKQDGIDYYYAETTLTFDLVGSQHAYSRQPFEFEIGGSDKTDITFNPNQTTPDSDLDFSLDINISLNLNNILKDSNTNSLQIVGNTTLIDYPKIIKNVEKQGGEYLQLRTRTYSLFNISLQNLSADAQGTYWLNLKYLSDSGIILYQYGNSQEKLLALQNIVSSGKRLVSSMTVNKFKWPGAFNSSVDYKNDNSNKITLSITSPGGTNIVLRSYEDYKTDDKQYGIVSVDGRAETNAI